MIALEDVVLQRLDRLPHGQIGQDRLVIKRADCGGVSRIILEAPHVTRRLLGQLVDWIQVVHEVANPGIIHRVKETSNVDLGQMPGRHVAHDLVSCIGSCERSTREVGRRLPHEIAGPRPECRGGIFGVVQHANVERHAAAANAAVEMVAKRQQPLDPVIDLGSEVASYSAPIGIVWHPCRWQFSKTILDLT